MCPWLLIALPRFGTLEGFIFYSEAVVVKLSIGRVKLSALPRFQTLEGFIFYCKAVVEALYTGHTPGLGTLTPLVTPLTPPSGPK